MGCNFSRHTDDDREEHRQVERELRREKSRGKECRVLLLGLLVLASTQSDVTNFV
jgi:hypothetical protein